MCVLISSQRPFLVCVCVCSLREEPSNTQKFEWLKVFLSFFISLGGTRPSIYFQLGVVSEARGVGREKIFCVSPSSFFVFYSIYLFQFFQLVTRQVVVNPLARWCCLTSARNSLSKCVRRRKRGDCEKGRESSRHRQGHHLETHRLITQVALFPFFFYFPIQKYCV